MKNKKTKIDNTDNYTINEVVSNVVIDLEPVVEPSVIVPQGIRVDNYASLDIEGIDRLIAKTQKYLNKFVQHKRKLHNQSIEQYKLTISECENALKRLQNK